MLVNSCLLPALGNKDDLNGFQADLKYGIARNYDVDLGYEFDQWTINNELGLLKNPTTGATASSGKPTEQYITLGVTHNFNQNASLKLLYQVDDYSDHSTWFDPNGDSQGSVALSQLSVKF
jgi:predicted porin